MLTTLTYHGLNFKFEHLQLLTHVFSEDLSDGVRSLVNHLKHAGIRRYHSNAGYSEHNKDLMNVDIREEASCRWGTG